MRKKITKKNAQKLPKLRSIPILLRNKNSAERER